MPMMILSVPLNFPACHIIHNRIIKDIKME